MSKINGPVKSNPSGGFPYKAVTVLVCCVSINAYTRVNLFPYVGIMAMQLMGLESINESGMSTLAYACRPIAIVDQLQ